mmetsp:Transcript_135560/g.433676  ORF Transcript_135560/g.433676 Transcript_135560/m.433676 type:complete len:332 (-) Transcript_135560:16-1011(-)
MLPQARGRSLGSGADNGRQRRCRGALLALELDDQRSLFQERQQLLTCLALGADAVEGHQAVADTDATLLGGQVGPDLVDDGRGLGPSDGEAELEDLLVEAERQGLPGLFVKLPLCLHFVLLAALLLNLRGGLALHPPLAEELEGIQGQEDGRDQVEDLCQGPGQILWHHKSQQFSATRAEAPGKAHHELHTGHVEEHVPVPDPAREEGEEPYNVVSAGRQLREHGRRGEANPHRGRALLLAVILGQPAQVVGMSRNKPRCQQRLSGVRDTEGCEKYGDDWQRDAGKPLLALALRSGRLLCAHVVEGSATVMARKAQRSVDAKAPCPIDLSL